ncbi:hypothetical protein SODALDRAFT_322278 [Sodiomyces alkalinus F11]|uniref:DUF1275 domain protein n=1 Tax=Sodiomyces alkalinus (strain CBS 110278 / VKM F-3762 / F11) TaxID=1314773 RepID=A0A3N2Q2S5_SODAK|nr:hypothetical protein SODALDRAFT_322278 [Sodiomyces alkalinus F11]ROT41069.1 hypothetical protein SODALDRAFT_322278 [Sodiomyces alkalinus F11]
MAGDDLERGRAPEAIAIASASSTPAGTSDSDRRPTNKPGATTEPSAATGAKDDKPMRRPWLSRLSRLQDDVHPRHTDLPLFACSFTSGLCDSMTVNAAGTFVSMQTGNTIFLALGSAGLPDDDDDDAFLWLRSLTSIASFALGCFVFGQARRLRARRKATLALSFLVQAAAIFLAAALAHAGVVADLARTSVPGFGAPDDFRPRGGQIVLLPVAILAWQFGGQIVTSRVLGYGEVPTCVLTSVYCDLFSDPNIVAPVSRNVKRNRRVGAICTLLVGGIAGGWLQRSPAGMTGVLWIAGSIKVAIACAWALWPSEKAAQEKGHV